MLPPNRNRFTQTMGVPLLAAALAIGQAWLNRQAGPPPYYETMQQNLSYDSPITDLQQWVGDNVDGRPDGATDDLTLTLADIDDDGRDEWLIDSARWNGAQNCRYAVFRRDAAAFFYVGCVGGSMIEVLPADADGRPRLWCYWHASACDGYFVTYSYDGKALTAVDGGHIQWVEGPDGEISAMETREPIPGK